MAGSGQSRRRVQSIEVGFRVLRVLRMAGGQLPLREIAARAAMPPSKVHLYLVSFLRENMAYQDPKTGHYGLGSFAIQLGLAAIRQSEMVGLASDVLAELRDRTDCAIYLSLWGDQGPCIVAKADGRLQGALAIRLGFILPAETTATGHVFLANMPREDTEEVLATQREVRLSPRLRVGESGVDLDAITAEVRKRGYGSTIGSLNQSFAGLAAPVFGPDGSLAAVMTLLGPTDYVAGERQQKFVKLLLDSAANVSARMAARAEAREEAAS